MTPLSLLSGTFYSVEPARADVPRDQPRQPVLLRDLGLPRGVPRDQRFAAVGRAIGLLVLNLLLWAACYALLRSGWKIKN